MLKHEQIIEFISSPVFELLASLFVFENFEKLNVSDKRLPEVPIELTQWREAKQKIIPNQMKKDIEVFFNIETFIGMTMVRFAYETNTHHSIEAFLQKLSETQPYDLFSSFLKTGYISDEVHNIEDLDEVTQFIQNCTIPEQEKWKLTYLYLNITQTKERFISLLENYYKVYFLEDIQMVLEFHKQSYQQLLETGALSSRENLGKTISIPISEDLVKKSEYKLIIAPSFFYNTASLTSEDNYSYIYLYGINQPSFNKASEISEDALLESMKIFSDEKRIKMMKILSKTPHYGYELAQKLNLSNSTVSHHLSALSSIGIVTSKRIENKVYFHLEKEKVRELLHSIAAFLTE